jgi:hypothetical protein
LQGQLSSCLCRFGAVFGPPSSFDFAQDEGYGERNGPEGSLGFILSEVEG